jgi:SAM-dependent methyltransferase
MYWAKIARYRKERLPVTEEYEFAFNNKIGIEIGGPSFFFQYVLPIYNFINSLDGLNFSNDTVWEGTIDAQERYQYFGKRTGKQFIGEASKLDFLDSNIYDFVISSNCLEHVANPIKALHEWIRIMKSGAYLLLVLPKKASNFDHRRPITLFEHLVDDYEKSIDEHDLTHLPEIMELHDLTKDLPAGNIYDFEKRSNQNFDNRCLHHHVFDLELIERLIRHVGLDVIENSQNTTDFVVLAKLNNSRCSTK